MSDSVSFWLARGDKNQLGEVEQSQSQLDLPENELQQVHLFLCLLHVFVFFDACFYCIFLFIVFVCLLILFVYCICLFIVFVCLLHLFVYCICLFIAFVCLWAWAFWNQVLTGGRWILEDLMDHIPIYENEEWIWGIWRICLIHMMCLISVMDLMDLMID